jgi:hypothetical protein
MQKRKKKSGPGRGGARAGAGRKPSGRSQIKVRIKTEIIKQLQPGAARKLAAIIERKFENKFDTSGQNL